MLLTLRFYIAFLTPPLLLYLWLQTLEKYCYCNSRNSTMHDRQINHLTRYMSDALVTCNCIIKRYDLPHNQSYLGI